MTSAVKVNNGRDYKKNKIKGGASSKAFNRIKSPKGILRRRGESCQTKTWKKKNMVTKLLQLQVEIREEQSSIKEGQRQVKQKFQAIESECKNLRQETMIVMQQSACTRLRLAFMFGILKARESNDFAKAAALTHALRKVIAQQNLRHQEMIGQVTIK